MQVNELVNMLEGKTQYDIEAISEEIYNDFAPINDVVNHYSGKIVKSLFDFFGVASDIPFDRVAARIFKGDISIGSVLAKIKKMKEDAKEMDAGTDEEQTDDEIIDNVMNNVKRQKPVATIKETPLINVKKTMITTRPPVDGKRDVKRVTPPVRDDKNAREKNFTAERMILQEEFSADIIDYCEKVNTRIHELVDNDIAKNFQREFVNFLSGDGKNIINEFGGNKLSVVASIAYTTIVGIVGERNVPSGSKKSFYEKLDTSASSCRRAEKRLKEANEGRTE